MSVFTLLLSFLVCAIAWYVLKAREVKERAVRAAFSYCERLSLTLLDQTVVLSKISVGRGRSGSICLIKDYKFDFSSTGTDRYEGRIRMLGMHVEYIKLEPHKVDDYE